MNQFLHFKHRCLGFKAVVSFSIFHPSEFKKCRTFSKQLFHLVLHFSSIMLLISCMPFVCFPLHFPRPAHSTWLSSQTRTSVFASSPSEKQLSGIQWKKDNFSSHASLQAAGKILNEAITAKTHFPDWIQRKPTFLESSILHLSQHSFKSGILSLLGPVVVQSSTNEEGCRADAQPDVTWKDNYRLGHHFDYFGEQCGSKCAFEKLLFLSY